MSQETLIRVVKLTLDPGCIDAFKQVFSNHRQQIANMEGCLDLQALQDKKEPHIIFTISRWKNEHALDNYRYSDFFKTLWATVKPMFTAKAMAHSLTPVQ